MLAALPRLHPFMRYAIIAVLAMAITGSMAISEYVGSGSDVTVFLRVGTFAPARPYVERSFPNAALTGDLGHDGQQFYVIASSLPDLNSATPYVDRVRYRARRIVFPLLVSPFRDGERLVWAMFAVNLAAIGAIAIGLGRLAERVAITPWFGVAAGFVPALIESLEGSLSDGLGLAFALFGVLLWRTHLRGAIVLLTLAALTRETYLIAPLVCLIVGDRRQRIGLLIPPGIYLAFLAFTSWWLPPARTDQGSVFGDAAHALTWPFKDWITLGFAQSGPLLGLALLGASGFGAALWWKKLPEISLWLTLDAVLLMISNVAVIERPLNIARVAPLALPAFLLGALARNHELVRPPEPSDPSSGNAPLSRR